MNELNLFTILYGKLRGSNKIPVWLLTPIRRLVRCIANQRLSLYLSKSHNYKLRGHCGVVVSFTSFPARIENVWQVVECMKRQSLQPRKILLWLSKEQFPTKETIPLSLKKREDDIFEIKIVEGDFKSHKKYLYVSREYPNDLIFLIDDDLYYSDKLIETSLNTYNLNPNSVICNYGYHITYSNRNVKPYNLWEDCYDYSEKNDIFFGSGGGTLFRPSDMYKDLTNIRLAQELAPMADDIWLNAMARLGKCKIIILQNGLLLPIKNKKNITLSSENKGKNMNDLQLMQVEKYYSNQGMKVFAK